jgi:hypothetical protein
VRLRRGDGNWTASLTSVGKSLTLDVFCRRWAEVEKNPIVLGVDTVLVYGRSGGCDTADNLSSAYKNGPIGRDMKLPARAMSSSYLQRRSMYYILQHVAGVSQLRPSCTANTEVPLFLL